MQLLLSIFIGWIILLSRVGRDYYRVRAESNATISRGQYIHRIGRGIEPKVAHIFAVKGTYA